jgi:hypothetical protein
MVNSLPEREASVHEAAAAKAAIRRVVTDTRHSLGTAVDVRLWTKKSPWIAVGAAAAAGLAAAVWLRRGGTRSQASCDAAPAVAKPQPPEPAKRGIGASIASSLFDLAKFGLETAIMGGIHEATAKRPPPSDYRNESTHAAY